MKAKLFSILSFASLILVCSLVSCTGNKTEKAPSLYNSNDSIEAENMTKVYLENLKNGDYDAALNMLSSYTNDSIEELMPLSTEQKESLIQQFQTFPVLKYTLIHSSWENPRQILYTYAIEFFEKDPDSDLPNTYNLNLRPIRSNEGEWHLILDINK